MNESRPKVQHRNSLQQISQQAKDKLVDDSQKLTFSHSSLVQDGSIHKSPSRILHRRQNR